MDRYKIYINIEGDRLVFKRYGKDENDIRKIMNTFMKENMPQWTYDIEDIEKDKTRSVGRKAPEPAA